MEISVTELQTILNRIIGKREPPGRDLGIHREDEWKTLFGWDQTHSVK